jgi:exosortase
VNPADPALPPDPPRHWPWPQRLVAIVALAAVAMFCLSLWPTWQGNPDLSHGFFAPLVFALLLWEGACHHTARWLPADWRSLAASLTCLLAALFALALAGLLAASVGWSHAVVHFVFAGCLVLVLAAAWLVLARADARAVPFNWTVFTAIALWVLAAPLPHGTYSRLTLELQSNVTSFVLHTLHVFGVPARQQGNVIELATTSVGVEEACSGIRSLVSCLYAGAFFAAWQVRRTGPRILLLVAAPLLAIGMNFARSLLLTLLANSGRDITGPWHDWTGYAILGLTAVILGGLAMLGEDRAPAVAAPTSAPPAATPRSGPALVFLGGGTFCVALLGFFVVSLRTTPPPPEINVNLGKLVPLRAEGWGVATATDLYQFKEILRTEHLMERVYHRQDEKGPFELTLYIAYWPAGTAPVSLVSSHTPDACWPGSGWAPKLVPERERDLRLGDHVIPRTEYRQFIGAANRIEHVWFWHSYDGTVISFRDPYSVPALVENALRYGFRREGEQYFVRLSSNRSWHELVDEPLVRQIFRNLEPLGL